MPRMRTLVTLTALLAVSLASPAAAHDQLPDLAMAPLADFRIEKQNGRTVLRYSATVVNIGAGPFEVSGARTSTAAADMPVVQHVHDAAGATRHVQTAARMYWSGDGHNHWHVRDLEDSVLERLDNGVKVGSGAKHGFCFYDNVAYRTLLGTPISPAYTTCGTNPDALAQGMGLSVGWGDRYGYWLVDQWVDITNVSPGQYRLRTTADAQNWFVESNELNNTTFTELQIKKSGPPRVTRQGPAA